MPKKIWMAPPGLAVTPNMPVEEVPWRVKVRQLRSIEFDDNRKQVFLAALQKHGKYAMACSQAGVTYAQFTKARENDEEFDEAVELTRKVFDEYRVHRLEVAAMTGHKEPIFGSNGEVGERTRFESGLRAMVLRAYDPERYGDKAEIEVKHSGAVYLPMAIDNAEWEKQFTEMQQGFESLQSEPEPAHVLTEGVDASEA